MDANRKAPASTLIVGGAGFIGSHVAEALLARGGEVRVLDDLSSGRATHLPLHDPNLELRVGDMLEAETVFAAMDGMECVVHLAAQPVRAGRDPYEAALSNILGFINVLQAARARDIRRVVYASSAAVYGEAGDLALNEDTPPQPVGPAAMEKLVAEAYANLYQRQFDMSLLGLRYFNVYGPRQARGVVPVLLERVGRHRPVTLHGDGHQTRDFIHVEDAARLTVAALAGAHTGVCNLGSGQRTELRELARLVALAFDRRTPVHYSPKDAPAIVHSWADVSRMRQWLGATPVRSLRAGLIELASDWEARQQRPSRVATRTPFVLPLLRPTAVTGRALS